MPNITNKEWIDNNNLKIDDLITQANELPDYQDIEPIYGSATYQFLDTKITSKSYAQITSFIDDYFSITYRPSNSSTTSTHYIYKYNNGNPSLITSFISYLGSDWEYRYVFILLDTDENYIYYIYGSNYVSNTKIYRCNKITGATEEYFNYPIRNSGSESAQTYFLDRNKILYGGQHHSKIIEFNMVNKTASTISISNNSCAVRPFNKDIAIGVSSNTTNYSNMKYVAYYTGAVQFKTYDGNVRFIDLLDNKIMIENSLYELNLDRTVGEKIKDNFLPTTEYNEFIYNTMINPIGDIYIYGKYIYKLNRDTYEMEKIYTLPSSILEANKYIGLGGYSMSIYYYDSSSTTYKIVDFQSTTETLIGYTYNGHIFSIKTPSGVSTDKVLVGTEVFDSTLTLIKGAMPNNGELNYTPSTLQQTIPAGYTSGGTVAAVSMTEQEIQEAEDIISDLFGEGENE